MVGGGAVAGSGSGRGGRRGGSGQRGGSGGAGGAGGVSTGTNGNFSTPLVTTSGAPAQARALGRFVSPAEAAQHLAMQEAQKKATVTGEIVAGDMGTVIFDDVANFSTVSGYVDTSAMRQPGSGNKVMMTNSFAAADRNSGVADFTFSLLDEASKANVADAGGGFNGRYWKSIPPAAALERKGSERRNVDGSADLDLYASAVDMNGGLAPNETTVIQRAAAREWAGSTVVNLNGGVPPNAAVANLGGALSAVDAPPLAFWSNTAGTVTLLERGITDGRKEQESAKTEDSAAVIDRRYIELKRQDSGEAKKSGSILADIPIVGGLFKSKEAAAAPAASPKVSVNYETAHNYATNGVIKAEDTLLEAKKAEAAAGKPPVMIMPSTHALDGGEAKTIAANHLSAFSPPVRQMRR